VADNLNLRTPTHNYFVGGTFNYAVTKDQTIRVGFNHNQGTQENLGVGGFNLADRAYSSFNHNTSIRVQEAGPVGRRFFINTRFTMNVSDSGAHSVLEAPTIIVNDQFTSGGAQVAGGRDTRTFSLLSDLDYVRGRNSWRAGVSLEGGTIVPTTPRTTWEPSRSRHSTPTWQVVPEATLAGSVIR